jgi:hypothetical protein
MVLYRSAARRFSQKIEARNIVTKVAKETPIQTKIQTSSQNLRWNFAKSVIWREKSVRH